MLPDANLIQATMHTLAQRPALVGANEKQATLQSSSIHTPGPEPRNNRGQRDPWQSQVFRTHQIQTLCNTRGGKIILTITTTHSPCPQQLTV